MQQNITIMNFSKNEVLTSLRYDRDIAANLSQINIKAGVIENKVLKKAILYISKIFQSNLLNEVVFDPEEFCKECNINHNDLQYLEELPYLQHLEELPCLLHLEELPYQFRNTKPTGEEKIDDNGFIDNKRFDNKFENILFFLAIFNFDITTEKDGVRTMATIQILKSVKAFRQGRKMLYYIKLGDEFRNNLMRRFLSIDMESYVSMCDIGADELYLQLVSLKSALKHSGTTYTTKENTIPFSILCSLAGLNNGGNNGNEYSLPQIEQILKDKLEAISKMKDMDFDIEWHRNDDPREPYIVCFHFRDTDGEFNKRVICIKNRETMQRVTNEHIIRKMASLYRELHKFKATTTLSEAEFLKWLSDRYTNVQEKCNTLERAYMELGNSRNIPENIYERIIDFFKGNGEV